MANVKIQFIPTRSRAWRCLLPLIPLAFTVGCWVSHSPDKATFSGGRAANGGFAISSPNLFIREGAPGVVFGTYGVPNMPDALSYFVLFKRPPGSLAQPGFAPRISARDEADGLSASFNLDIGGARLSIAHRIALNESRNGIAKETLSIEGKALDVSAGRFFYVDLTAKPFRIEQKNIPLPNLTANLEHPEEAERFAEEAFRAIEAKSPDVARMAKR